MLRVEQVADGFHFPTGRVIIDQDDILLIEKEKAIIYRIIDGKIANVYPLDLSPTAIYKEGILGIALDNKIVSQNQNNKYIDIFLYINECGITKLDLF